MKRQSILAWIIVITAATSVYSTDWQLDWVDGSNIPISWNWSFYPSHFPPLPHPPGTIPFSGPTGVFSNEGCAIVDLGGTPTITIDSYQKTIELWFQPPAPNDCWAIWDPVCGLKGWFGPLSEGDWLFYSNQIPPPYGPFYINFHVPTLTILNPNGDEYLLVGSTYTIRWEDSRSERYCGGNYLLDYSINDGNSWVPVDSNTISNTCSYDWLVPSIDANQCLIRITDADDPNITDTSDQPFYIYHDFTITILHPNGDERLLGGSTYAIRWKDSRSGSCGSSYLLDYSIDNGNNWIPVDSNPISNTCSYDWLVPSIFSNQCLVRITDAGFPSIRDTSDDSFSIYRCTTNVLGDWNGDCYVEFGDFSIIAAGWNVPGGTDFNDLATLVQYWLDCANPLDPSCSFGEAMPEYPIDGALIEGDKVNGNISTSLIFVPGVTAVEHKGYFNEDYSKVASRHPDANLGPPPYAQWPGYEYTFWVGNPGVPPAYETLVRGTTYYWTVDETDAQGNTFAGDIWEFTIQDFKATSPTPPNEATFVETDVLLSWQPGYGVYFHDIYIGTSWEDVNNAVYDDLNPPPEFLGTTTEPNILVTGLLDNTRYYWRVDEVHWSPLFFPPYEFYKGDVWCFTTISGSAEPNFPPDGATIDNRTPALEWIPGVHADYHELYFSENFDDVNNRNPIVKEITIDPCRPYPPAIPPLQLGRTYYWLVDEVRSFPLERWNARSVWCFTTVSGSAMPHFPADGLVIPGEAVHYPYDYIWTKLVFISGATAVEHTGYFSDDYSKVESRAEDANLGSPPYAHVPGWEYVFFAGHPEVPPADESLVRGSKYYWTVDETDALGNTFGGEIWEFTIQDYKAMLPNPPNEATFVETDVLLYWQPGYIVEEHDIYMGTSWEDVNNARYDYFDPPPEFVATVEEPNIFVTGLLDNTTYYWRVDEVAGRKPPFPLPEYYKGDVWCFTTTPSALNNDGSINLKDYPILSNYRQKTGPILPVYIRKDDVVDYKDLRILMQNWLWNL